VGLVAAKILAVLMCLKVLNKDSEVLSFSFVPVQDLINNNW